MTNSTEAKEYCLSCKRNDVHLIVVTDHPEYRNGDYCEECNPYEQDRRRDCARVSKEISDALDEVFKRACKYGSYYTDGNNKAKFVIELKELKQIIQQQKRRGMINGI